MNKSLDPPTCPIRWYSKDLIRRTILKMISIQRALNIALFPQIGPGFVKFLPFFLQNVIFYVDILADFLAWTLIK